MKKLIFISILTIAVAAANSQTIKKGALVGIHYGTTTLNAGFTVEQLNDFYLNKYIPAVEKSYPGTKLYMVKSIRGENQNTFGILIIFESEKMRDKYYNADGSLTDAGETAQKKMQLVLEEVGKMGTLADKYTDWVVQ